MAKDRMAKMISVTLVLNIKTDTAEAHLFFCSYSYNCNQLGPTASADAPTGQ